MQLIKYDLFQHSPDDSIRTLISIRIRQEERFTRVWKPAKLTKAANAEVDLHLKFPIQSNQAGLGQGNFNPNPSHTERRKLITSKALSFSENERLSHAVSLAQQGVWLKWADLALPFDFSWSNVIWGTSPQIVSFVLNASLNWVTTPHLLKLWGLKESAFCLLCSEPKCTLHHIISSCQFSLQSKRYIWRHDSVLMCLKPFLEELISAANKKIFSPLTLGDLFVKAGQKNPMGTKSIRHSCKSELDGASDWKLLIDFELNRIIFPPEICVTNERPDIIIWSTSLKKVILLELTCPAEEGILAAQHFKEARYLPLVQLIKLSGWKPVLFTMEVGARGFVAHSFLSSLIQVGVSRSVLNKLRKSVSLLVARCSYHILQASTSKEWDHHKPLLI